MGNIRGENYTSLLIWPQNIAPDMTVSPKLIIPEQLNQFLALYGRFHVTVYYPLSLNSFNKNGRTFTGSALALRKVPPTEAREERGEGCNSAHHIMERRVPPQTMSDMSST